MLPEYRGQADAQSADTAQGDPAVPRDHRLPQNQGIANLINRDFTSEHPNDLWLSDITYVPTREGWLYLAAVLDAYSRALVGWAMSRTLDTKLAMDALNMAIAHRGPPVTLHSDQGSTYATGSYREIVYRHGIRQSMSRKGDCWDTQYTMTLNDRPSLTRAGIGQRALALTCRLWSGVPRALPGRAPVT
jgi:putative transposase